MVVGVADHSGWAFLVSSAAVNGVPTVIDRRRVPLIEKGVPNLPYEHDTQALSEDEAEQLLRHVKRSIAASTTSALDHLSADLQQQYRIACLTIRQPTLDQLPATVAEARRSYHVVNRADGMLYHSAICTAARQRDWSVVFHRRGNELTAAAATLKTTPSDVERFIASLGRTLRPPWSAEHRSVFAASIGELGKLSRIDVLPKKPTARR